MMLATPRNIWFASFAATLTLLCERPVLAAQTLGSVTDKIDVIRISKIAPVQIELDSQCGAETATKHYGGRIMGHAIKLNFEDDQYNAEGGQTATTKLAANPQTVTATAMIESI